MELTNILGQAFLVNVDSVVYAYTRGSGATLVMSRNKELVYVTESVSEVVTASGTGLVAFTSTEGDVTGSVAINPNYIQTVTSVDGGDSSGLILGDNSGVRATLVVTTDYANMDAIVEASAGGGPGGIYTDGAGTVGAAVVATMQEDDALNINFFDASPALTIDDSDQSVTVTAPGGATVTGNLTVSGTINGQVTPLVYTALLSQTAPATDTSGDLIVGQTYTITTYVAGDDFANVANVQSGTINVTGCVFIATGTTPTDWSNGSTIDSGGLPFGGTLQNTTGTNLTWSYEGTGEFIVTGVGVFSGSVSVRAGSLFGFVKYYLIDDDSIQVFTADTSGSNADEILENTTVEILVYP